MVEAYRLEPFCDYDDHSMAKYFGFHLSEVAIEEILDVAFKSHIKLNIQKNLVKWFQSIEADSSFFAHK